MRVRGERTPFRSRAACNPSAHGEESEAGGGGGEEEHEVERRNTIKKTKTYEELDLLVGTRPDGRLEAEDLQRSLLVAPSPLKQLDVRGHHCRRRVIVTRTVMYSVRKGEGGRSVGPGGM